MNHLEGLNPEQLKAVLHTEGPLLIVAGAGAGKTKTLTHRILHLILQKGVHPEQILAVTFTNKAAKEMQSRIARLLFGEERSKRLVSWPGKSGLPFIATFHALGVYLLRENAERMGLPRGFTIFDAGDSLAAIRASVKEEGFDPKVLEPKLVQTIISKNKSDFHGFSDYEEREGSSAQGSKILRVWRRYEQKLKDQRAVDFDDLLLKSVRLLQTHPDVREKYQNFWKYLHIDEYQDTNKLQYELSSLLCGKEKNICVVGDADQNIYSWRGADISNILHFEKDYPGAKVVLLEENYRSTDIILQAANEVIAKNSERIEKNLFTRKKSDEKIGLFECYNEYDEAEKIASKIAELAEAGADFSDVAILYRANFQSRVLEEALLGAGIPYQVLGVKFFERKEVKDILSYLRAAQNPESIPDISRIINTPARGIGKVTLEKVLVGQTATLPPKTREKVNEFFALLENIRASIVQKPPSEVIAEIIHSSGLETFWKEKKEEGQDKLENMYELTALAKKYDSYEIPNGTEKLLEDAALMSEQDSLTNTKNSSGIRLMTIHAAKGLEFPYVFITGLEQGLFPHQGFGGSKDAKSAEEERRLFYVAITRAEKKLFLSHASVRTKFGSKEINIPSEFLSDISEELLEKEESHSLLPPAGSFKTIFFD
ncbi:MAG TPA: UvrD-helicase domain-containing protein [Candidatus Paceibacterota bacterium]|nr:UvrD-helicase domain-containing protein [Candidatus Paceibacterota bacterium]